MSSDSRSGSSCSTCSRVSPLASNSKTSETRIRIPRMQGRPPHCSGFTVMRGSRVAVLNVHPRLWGPIVPDRNENADLSKPE